MITHVRLREGGGASRGVRYAAFVPGCGILATTWRKKNMGHLHVRLLSMFFPDCGSGITIIALNPVEHLGGED